MTGTTTDTASGERATGDRSPSCSAVGICCRHGAAILRMADRAPYEQDKLKRIQEANDGQAELLMRAADIADEMLSCLLQCALELDEAASIISPNLPATGRLFSDAAKRTRELISNAASVSL